MPVSAALPFSWGRLWSNTRADFRKMSALTPPTAPEAAPPPARAAVPLAGLLAFLGVGGVLMAGAVALASLPWLSGQGWAAGSAGAWSAALGATAGLVLAGVPMALLVWKLARELAPGGGRADAGAAPTAGMARPLFMTLAEREFARARRYGTGAALVLVDIDRYARLCEARGLAAGDAVLAHLLCLTAPTLRTADVLTQFGPAQMAIFLVHADATGALDVAERLRERAEQMEVPHPEHPAGAPLRVTVSTGVAHLRPAHLNLQALVEDAQDALIAARAAGGNCVRAAPVDLSSTSRNDALPERRRTQPRPNNDA